MSPRNTFLLLAVVLSGCVPAARYQPPAVPLPATFRERPDQPPLPPPDGARPSLDPAAVPAPADAPAPEPSGFWKALGDPTLERLIALGMRSNLDVRVAAARIRGARAARRSAALDFAPTVTASAGFSRQRIATASFPGASGSFPDQSIWDAGFDAAWELDVFGRIRREVTARGALVEAAGADLRNVQVSLAAELARTYFELRGAQSRLSVATRNAENQRRTLALTRDRLASGIGSGFDSERAQAQLSSTLATVPAFEAEVAAAQYRIGVLVGQSPAALVAELGEATGIPALPAEVPIGSPDSLLRRRPDVAAAERRAAAGLELVGASKASYLPTLSIGGTTGFTSGALDGFGRRGTFRYAVGPVISWPAFNLGRVKAAVDASRAFEEEARAEYHQTALRALEEIEVSIARYRASRTQVDRIREAAEASQRAADLARTRFVEGVADFLQVLDAERTQLAAEDQLAAAEAAAATAYAVLFKAVGGG